MFIILNIQEKEGSEWLDSEPPNSRMRKSLEIGHSVSRSLLFLVSATLKTDGDVSRVAGFI